MHLKTIVGVLMRVVKTCQSGAQVSIITAGISECLPSVYSQLHLTHTHPARTLKRYNRVWFSVSLVCGTHTHSKMLNENLFLAKRYLKTNVNHLTYYFFSICTSNLIYTAHFANLYFYHFIILSF